MFKFQITAEDYAEKYGDSVIRELIKNERPRITCALVNELAEEIMERIALAGDSAPANHVSKTIDVVAVKYEKVTRLINQQANRQGLSAVLLPFGFKPLLKECFPETLGPYIRAV